MGRNANPAALRELLGTQYRRKRHLDTVPDAEKPDSLPPSDASVAPPAYLHPDERKFWHYFAPLLAGARMLTPADTQTLVDYCRASYWVETTTARLRRAWKKRHV